MSDRLRWVGAGLVTSAGAGILGLTAMMNSAFAYGAPVPVIPDITQVMGGSGLPIPPPLYVEAANAFYIQPYLPGTHAVPLNTPENLYPLFPPSGFAGAPEAPSLINQLTLDSSVAQGATILDNELVANGLNAADPQGVFGYSQSAIIATMEMNHLIAEGGVQPSAVDFTLIGDPNLPDGGLLSRFPGLDLSALGLTFSGATPSDAFDTTINTIQYDGFADFPKYPINLLSDINAFLGIETLHGHYLDPSIAELPRTLLPGSAALGTPDSLTNYFIIDTTGLPINPTGLPLLNPIYDIPGIGHPLAALLQPDLTYLVNLGYGDGSLGYSDTAANVATPFGLFPDINPLTFLQTLGADTAKGFQDMMAGTLMDGVSYAPSSVADPTTAISDLMNTAASLSPTEFITNFANAISSAASTAYGALLPTTDILNSLVTSVPAYDLSLFVDGIQSIPTEGLTGLVNAFGLPIAADVGIVTLAAGFELTIIEGTITNITTELSGLIP